jgi:O-antigen/teichoic acid export membrane protein
VLKKFQAKLITDVHLKDLLKGSAITFVLKMGGLGLSYFLVYIISKQSGAEGVGFYHIFSQTLTVFGMTLALGMNISVLRYVGQFNSDEHRPKLHTIYKYFLQTVGPLAIVISVILYFNADYMVQWTGRNQEYVEMTKLIAIALPFFTINQISVEFIRGLKKLKVSEFVRSVLRPLVMLIGIFVFFYDNLTKIDIIYLLVVGIIANSLVSRWTIWQELKKVPKTAVGFGYMEFIKTSYPMLMTGLSSVLLGAMPIFFLDYYTTQAEVGVYSVAFRLASLVSLVLVVVNTIAAPKFAELYWAGKMQELQKVITQSTKLMFWVALSLTTFLIVGGNFLLQLFGEEFKEGYWVLVILLLGQLVNAATGSVGVFMNMSGRQRFVRNLIVIMLIVQTILMLPVFYLNYENHLILISSAASIILILQNLTLVILLKKTSKIKTYYLPLVK